MAPSDQPGGNSASANYAPGADSSAFHAQTAANNQAATSAGVRGGGGSGGWNYQSGVATGGGMGGGNPFNQPLTFGANTPGFFMRDQVQIERQVASALGGGGGGGLPPRPPSGGGGSPSWGAGDPGGGNWRQMRQMADYENRDYDLRMRRQRQQADYENGVFDRANSPPGGGQGGRLGGTLGSWVGQRALGSMLGGAGGIALAAEAGKDIFFAPQWIAGKEREWLGATAQARNYIGSTSVMGQSGGFNSVDFRTGLRRASERGGDDWLLRTGLGPDEAAQMVSDLGVVPRSTEQATGLARNLANSRITPGMSGIPIGMQTGILRDMLGIGATTLNNVPGANNDLGAIMKQTAQTEQDQLRVLRSIDTGVVSLSTTPGATTAIGPDSLFQANQRFIATPGGMAGIAGEQSINATEAAWSTVGSNPARTIVASTVVDKLKSEKSLREYFGSDNWDKFTASPVGREMADKYLHDINAGHTYGAMLIFSNGLMKDPTLASSVNAQSAMINNPVTNQYGPGQEGLQLTSQSNLSNMSMADVTAFNMARKRGVALGTAANNPMNLSDTGRPPSLGFVTAADKQKIAVFPNMATGVAESINQLRRYESGGLMSPRELAAKWLGHAPSEAYVNSIADQMGIGPDTKANMNDPAMARAYIKGAQPFETGPARLSSADLNSGVDLAFSRKSANPNLRTDDSADPNVPGYNPTVGTAKSDALGSGSERTLRQGQNLNENLNAISDYWRPILLAVEGLASAIRAAATMAGNSVAPALH